MLRAAKPLLLLTIVTTASVFATTPSENRGQRIRNFAQRWLGTPYAWGGNDRQGIDCSAYLKTLYSSIFSIDLPRTTHSQIELGQPLRLNPRNLSQGLEPGDLIFYVDRSGTPNHVVVYAGHNEITHSISGRGVVLEPLSRVYGRRVSARRFLVPRRSGALAPLGALKSNGPIATQDIPCPKIRHPTETIRSLSQRNLTQTELGHDICTLRAIAAGLAKDSSETAKKNAAMIQVHIDWLINLDQLKEDIGRGW